VVVAGVMVGEYAWNFKKQFKPALPLINFMSVINFISPVLGV
jgi:hypothetical protein